MQNKLILTLLMFGNTWVVAPNTAEIYTRGRYLYSLSNASTRAPSDDLCNLALEIRLHDAQLQTDYTLIKELLFRSQQICNRLNDWILNITRIESRRERLMAACSAQQRMVDIIVNEYKSFVIALDVFMCEVNTRYPWREINTEDEFVVLCHKLCNRCYLHLNQVLIPTKFTTESFYYRIHYEYWYARYGYAVE